MNNLYSKPKKVVSKLTFEKRSQNEKELEKKRLKEWKQSEEKFVYKNTRNDLSDSEWWEIETREIFRFYDLYYLGVENKDFDEQEFKERIINEFGRKSLEQFVEENINTIKIVKRIKKILE